MNERTKAAVIGGALAGVLSALPVVSTCCCLWAIGGGILAVFLYTKNTRATLTPGDGAMLGAVAGGIGAVAYLIIAVPINLIFGAAMMAAQFEQMQRAGVEIPFSGMAAIVMGVIMGAVGVFVFTVIGGLIGAPIFGKGAGTPPPPPPPAAGGFGGGPAGGGGGSFGQGS